MLLHNKMVKRIMSDIKIGPVKLVLKLKCTTIIRF